MDVLEITEAPAEEVVDQSQESQFATVGEVFDDGVTLIFDGQETATEKHYKVNTSIVLVAGDRVKILKDSGTYVVEYVVGVPGLGMQIPSGGTEGQALVKDGAEDYGLKWATIKGVPSGGTEGQVLAKASNDSYVLTWKTISQTNYIPAGGSDGQLLAKSGSTAYTLKWVDKPENTNYIPSGGSDGQFLVKNGTSSYALRWAANPIPTGGSDGQLLAKNGSTNYSLAWVTAPTGIPSGGTSGQVLKKDSSTNYDVSWGSVEAQTNQLYYSSTDYCALNSSRQLVPHAHSSSITYSLGSSSLPWASLYIGRGVIQLGNNASYNYLGFFGYEPVRKQTLSTSSTNMSYSSATSSNYLTVLNNLVGILKNKYGLIY